MIDDLLALHPRPTLSSAARWLRLCLDPAAAYLLWLGLEPSSARIPGLWLPSGCQGDSLSVRAWSCWRAFPPGGDRPGSGKPCSTWKAFRTPQGTYRFPGGYLRESEGYYVSGYGMGLGENRRKPLGLEIESTFRMLKIRRLSDVH